ncbi:MAG: 2'-5' RNA ligase family protein [Rudanella sp.]|nr:2'-5' RNA ligase family protein [Rudanella sp.]
MKKQPGKQANAEQLYFIGLLPPEPIQQEVTAFKQQALERFGAGHALTSPPHVPLIPPFRSTRPDFSALSEFADAQSTFDLRLTGFNRFDQKVLFVEVDANNELVALQKELELYVHYYLGVVPDYQPYHPHMTVAFKDLKRPIFPQAWAYFSEQTYQRSFTANALSLFKYNGKTWEVMQEWGLNV